MQAVEGRVARSMAASRSCPGLAAGDRVIVQNTGVLADGALVRIEAQ